MIDIGRLVHLLFGVRYSAHDASEKTNETYSHLSSIGRCISGGF